MNFSIWLLKKTIDVIKEVFYSDMKYLIFGFVLSMLYLQVLVYFNGSNIMKTPYFELAFLSLGLIFIPLFFKLLFNEYKKEENKLK